MTATGAVELTQRLAAAGEATAVPQWWTVTSGVLLTAAGAWATWAQFVYPKIAERRAKRDALTGGSTPAASTPPTTSPNDLVGVMFANAAQRLDAIYDDLEQAHRKHARDSGTIARLTAELAECRRSCTCHNPPGGPTP